jgi:hypothetical protein
LAFFLFFSPFDDGIKNVDVILMGSIITRVTFPCRSESSRVELLRSN